jgi:hypothetical protein
MLYTIAVILLVVWLLGFVGLYTMARSFMCSWSPRSCSSSWGCSAGDASWDSNLEAQRVSGRLGWPGSHPVARSGGRC